MLLDIVREDPSREMYEVRGGVGEEKGVKRGVKREGWREVLVQHC